MAVSPFIYEDISREITEQLDRGLIPGGEKLPSLRMMSQRFGCSLSVVMQAYAILEAQGRIYSVEKSGFFASAPSRSPLPAPEKDHFTLESHEIRPLSILSRIVEASNDYKITPLGAGVPDQSYLPLGSLKAEINRILRERPSLLTGYSEERGDEGLRWEIGRLMARRGVDAAPEEILLTNGCTEALSLAVQSCSSPGDIIALESPVFLGTIQMLKVLKRRIITIPTSPSEGMDLGKLEEALRREDIKAVMMTALFQNPLGYVMPREKREAAVVLTGRYGVTLIEDDIYHDCSFRPLQEPCLKSFDRDGHVIYCSSFSKTLAPGLRAGWMIGGGKNRALTDLKMSQTLGNTVVLQKALARFLASGRYENQIIRMQKIMQRQQLEMTALLASELPEGTALSKPEGGYYLWVELPGEWDTLELFERALAEGISIVPGPAFSSENRYGNCMRISFASPLNDSVREGVRKLAGLIGELSR